MSNPGVLQFWQRVTGAKIFGAGLLQAVNARLRDRPQLPDKSIVERLEWLRFEPDEVGKAQDVREQPSRAACGESRLSVRSRDQQTDSSRLRANPNVRAPR